jgi:hypothetical protein
MGTKMKNRNYLLANVISEVSLNVSADSLDLSRWIFGISDTEYQGCAKDISEQEQAYY